MDTKLIEDFAKLPYNFWDFSKEDTKQYTHGLHTYPAVMVSPISRNIIKMVSKYKKINSLYDPFAGSGTVLVEGMLANIPIVTGTDINPLALFLTKVKTTKLNLENLEYSKKELFKRLDNAYKIYNNYIAEINQYIEQQGYNITSKHGWGDNAYEILIDYLNKHKLPIQIPNFKNLGYWFKPNVILELSIIKKELEEENTSDIKDFFLIAFSEIIRLVSNRRNGEFKMYRIREDKIISHNPNTYQEFEKILTKNLIKMRDFIQYLDKMNISSHTTIHNESACLLEKVEDDFYDLVITSPPYGDSRTTVAYGEYSRLSLQWMNIYNLSDKEITTIDKSLMGGNKFRNGFEYNLSSDTLRTILEKIYSIDIERAGDVYSFYNDLEQSISAIAKKTKKDGYHFWVVGNRTVKGHTLETDKIIAEIATRYQMCYVNTINRNIPNKVMPSLNSPSNKQGETVSTMTSEYIVVLRKEV